MSRKPDLRAISSIALDDDGDFDEVHVLGGLQATGSLNATIVDIKGSINLQGSLWATNVTVLGGCSIGADLIVELDINIQGGIKTGGKLQGRDIYISGGVNTKEGIKAVNLDVKGGIKATGNIEVDSLIDVLGGITSHRNIKAKELSSVGGITAGKDVDVKGLITARGKIEVGGDIDCDEFVFQISGPSFIEGKLTANKIRIEKDEFSKVEAFLRVEEIVSSNRIDIDYVIAERVICPKTRAGENCRIGESIDKSYDPDY
ncbi:MAG: hypothetical protein ACTSSH_09780 [Candidatus Heimdallarchaeota archaeon]